MERVVGFIAVDYRRPVGPVVMAAVLATAAGFRAGQSGGPFVPAVALALGLLGTAPIALIRRYPAAAIGLVLTANAAFVLLGRLSWSVAAVIGWLFALAASPVLLPRRTAITALAMTELTVLLAVVGLNGNVTPWDATAAEALAVLAAYGAGEMVRARRQSVAAQAAVAAQLRMVSERALVARERAGLARELHDVVAHHVSMIAVRAATAPYSVPELPESGLAAFAEIAEEARTALAELRVVLGVLRSPGGVADAEPAPTIGDLDGLVERMLGAGMDVTLSVSGPVRPLPASAELCCYRIVQEALTNAGRHAQGSQVRIAVRFSADELATTVCNSRRPAAGRGSGAAEPDRGFGLTGLRERVALLQGTFSAGPDESGGFTVSAVIPVPGGQAK